MNTQDIQNVGAASEAAVAQDTNEISFAAKAKAVACKAKEVAGKVAFGTIATACTVSAVACATYRVIRLVRLIKGDEK